MSENIKTHAQNTQKLLNLHNLQNLQNMQKLAKLALNVSECLKISANEKVDHVNKFSI